MALNFAIQAETQVEYTVKYSGGSIPNLKPGEDLKMFIDGAAIRLRLRKSDAAVIPTGAVTEISYGQEVHHRIGTAVGLAVISLGIGAITAFSKSKKHYIGITWADRENKGGIALQADKNEYRGLLAALEGVTGRKVVDTDVAAEAAAKTGLGQPVTSGEPSASNRPIAGGTAPNASANAAQTAVPGQMERASTPPAASALVDITFASNPPGALVSFSGMSFSNTPFVTKLQPGAYSVKLTLAGYSNWETEITVEAGKPATVVAQLNSTTGVALK
jgi:hypothetical protein